METSTMKFHWYQEAWKMFFFQQLRFPCFLFSIYTLRLGFLLLQGHHHAPQGSTLERGLFEGGNLNSVLWAQNHNKNVMQKPPNKPSSLWNWVQKETSLEKHVYQCYQSLPSSTPLVFPVLLWSQLQKAWIGDSQLQAVRTPALRHSTLSTFTGGFEEITQRHKSKQVQQLRLDIYCSEIVHLTAYFGRF